MSIKRLCSVGSVFVALAVASGCAAAANSGQTIYLDPQTGKVIQHPAPTARTRQRMATGGGDGASSKARGNKRWQTKNGTRMLSVNPRQAPRERIVRCADGSLHMGSVGHGDAKHNNDPKALCGQSGK